MLLYLDSYIYLTQTKVIEVMMKPNLL